jgi:predicted nucleic acid-binding protein
MERHEMAVEQYFSAVRRLIADAWGERIVVEDIGYVNPFVQADVETKARKHNLDFSDALQLVTILKGSCSTAELGSQPVLITADRNLAIAARSEGVRVWNCIDDPEPSWD